jgi:hypothetical protein
MPADTAGAPSNDARKWDTADEDSMRRPNVGTATSSGRFPSPLNTASPHCLAEAFGRFPRRFGIGAIAASADLSKLFVNVPMLRVR